MIKRTKSLEQKIHMYGKCSKTYWNSQNFNYEQSYVLKGKNFLGRMFKKDCLAGVIMSLV